MSVNLISYGIKGKYFYNIYYLFFFWAMQVFIKNSGILEWMIIIMIATIRLIDWLTVCGFYGVSTIFHPCKGGQQLDDNAVALHSTCASVLVSGGFVARETHTPIGILCCLTASIDAQIGEKTTFISCESSPFSTKFWVSLCKNQL